MKSSRAVVIGGGVIGACCALYLRREGWNVTLLDRARFGQACSHGNCGYVCPSHVLPLAEPGAAWGAVRAMFKSNSPFYIRPRLDWKLWSWLLRFAGRCNSTDMLQAAEGIAALLHLSMREFDALKSAGLECEWDSTGLLFVYSTRHEFDAYEKTNELLRERFKTPAQRIEREALLTQEPALKPCVAGAWLYDSDAQLRPEALMRSLRAMLEEKGVEIVENATVESFGKSETKATSVKAGTRSFDADAFVLATGAWSPQFESELGLRLPIQPGKGYSLTYPRPAKVPTRPMIFHERRVACSPFRSGFRLGSTMEFSGYDDSLNRRRMQLLTDAAREYLVEPLTSTVEEEWFGWRPMTYDSLPIIGPSPRLPNVFVAAGHSMLGVTLAPATGHLIADLVSNRKPGIDPRPYCPQRFS